jgi:hypothetical protein
MRYARDHTSYWNELIPRNISPDNVFACFKLLPAITSDDVSYVPDYFISDQYNSMDSYFTTAGGTGVNPSQIVLSNESYGL